MADFSTRLRGLIEQRGMRQREWRAERERKRKEIWGK